MTRYEDWSDLEILEEIDDVGQGLTNWEIERCEEWLRGVRMGERMTPGERAKAIQIAEERCP